MTQTDITRRVVMTADEVKLDFEDRYLKKVGEMALNEVVRIDVRLIIRSGQEEIKHQINVYDLLFDTETTGAIKDFSQHLIGIETGQKFTAHTICWQRLDGSGNLRDVSRLRSGHTPKKKVTAEEALRLSKVLVLMVGERWTDDFIRMRLKK